MKPVLQFHFVPWGIYSLEVGYLLLLNFQNTIYMIMPIFSGIWAPGWLLQQITADLVVYNKRNVFPHSSGSQKFKISFSGLKSNCQQGQLEALEALGKNSFQLLVVSCLPWLVTSSLHSLPSWWHCLLLFHVCEISLWFPLIKIPEDNSG